MLFVAVEETIFREDWLHSLGADRQWKPGIVKASKTELLMAYFLRGIFFFELEYLKIFDVRCLIEAFESRRTCRMLGRFAGYYFHNLHAHPSLDSASLHGG